MTANPSSAVAQDRQAPPVLLTKALIRKHYVPVGERTLDRWISSGTFPRPDIAIGGKVRFWRRETIERWIDAQAGGGSRE
jgi:predicted DNA-binding transcriptional regulator AlpA